MALICAFLNSCNIGTMYTRFEQFMIEAVVR